MRINIKFLIILILAIVFGGIIISNSAGIWKTQSEKIPNKINSDEGQEIYDPMSIKGSYTFSDVSKYFEIPIEDLAKAFGLNISKAKSFKCKDVKTLNTEPSTSALDIDSVRYFVAFYKGIRVDLNVDVYLPSLAKDIIINKGKPLAEQVEYLNKHLIEIER
ncbi:hypothetical protein [Caldicellulosiruptor acetigenus]|uniref:hypothetical protein n=1 Tax=Caldicellulosiruptor acetigenus TaxID=301953 RepID=UPI000405C88E|nr:hypothetical protein [Caldicellulosiruptor acetigenus]WAM36001.1 hypothetical protein OTK01_002382 [Caldicellulosiruptor acetigenus]